MVESIWPETVVAGELSRASLEWVLGNGAGSYASSTIAQMSTRRYHGLLVVPVGGLENRHVILAHLDLSVDTEQGHFDLATHQFPDVAPTEGYRYIERFAQDPLPRTTYRLGDGVLEQTFALVPASRTLVVRYQWHGPRTARLTVRPLLAMRHVHDLSHRHGAMRQLVEMQLGRVSVRPVPSLPSVTFLHSGGFVGSPDWWYRFELWAERERGLPFQEDLWTPGVFRFEVNPDEPQWFVCSADRPDHMDAAMEFEAARKRLLQEDPGPRRHVLVRKLSVAAPVFRCESGTRRAIVAGYPWFHAWARFSVLAVRGLYVAHGDAHGAVGVMRTLLQHMDGGLLPCELVQRPAEGGPWALDASLVLWWVAEQLMGVSDSAKRFAHHELMPTARKLFERLRAGELHGVRVSEQGFLVVEDSWEFPTWMNARVEGRPVTPRRGIPIELQAYWLRACESFCRMNREDRDELSAWLEQVRRSLVEHFLQSFWPGDRDYPYDFLAESLRPTEGSFQIRPNALLALAAAPELFSHHQAEAILGKVDEELMTPMGIRTLAPSDPLYRGTNRGPLAELDRSYHQGSAWPYLLGAYATASKRLWGKQGRWTEHVLGAVSRLLESPRALGQVPELADGDPPYRSAGCFAFAPSVAELLRALVQDLEL